MSSEQSRDGSDKSLFEMLFDYIVVLYSYKWLIIGITSLAAVGILLYALISLKLPPEKSPLPNTYTAQTVLLMQQDPGASLESTLLALGLTPTQELGAASIRFDTSAFTLRIIQSNAILDPLIDEFFTEKYATITPRLRFFLRKSILKDLSYQFVKGTRALTISYESIDPVFARDILVRLVELLDEWFTSRGGTTKLGRKRLLEEKLLEIKAEISVLETEIEAFQKKYGVLTVEELASAQTNLLANLRTQLMLKEMEIKTYSQLARIEDPWLFRLKSERDTLLDLIGQIEGGFTSFDDSILPSIQNLPKLAREFGDLTRALSLQTRIYEALAQQYELAKLSLESEPEFQVLEKAEIPVVKSGPKRSRLCITATLIAFAGSIMLAIVIESIKKVRRRLAG